MIRKNYTNVLFASLNSILSQDKACRAYMVANHSDSNTECVLDAAHTQLRVQYQDGIVPVIHCYRIATLLEGQDQSQLGPVDR